jgi:PAS domain S-box
MGSHAYMFERASIVRDANGRAIRVVGAMRDVTQRKRAEEATLRLAAIVASATDAIVGKTTDGIVTSWNAAAERMFGYSEREMVGRSIFELVPEELHDEERAVLARVRQGERVEFSLTERFRKDRSRLSISLSVSPIWDSSGRVVGVSSIKRDVTERKRANDELLRREERYRALVMATTSVVWTTDPEGNFIEPQPAWERYTGQSWEEHQGSGWMNALHPEDREPLRISWLEARDSRSFYEAAGGSGIRRSTGIVSSSPARRRCGEPMARCGNGSGRSPMSRNSGSRRSACGRRTAWRRWGGLPAASPTRRTTR